MSKKRKELKIKIKLKKYLPKIRVKHKPTKVHNDKRRKKIERYMKKMDEI